MQSADFHAQRFAADASEREAIWAVLVQRWFQRYIPVHSTVLDLGAGYCEFINQVCADRRIAIDRDAACAQFAGTGVELITHDLTRPWLLPDDSVDVVFASNVLEHLRDKQALADCLSETFRVLKPDSRFIALGPNIRFCSNVYWDSIDHCIPLSDRSLVEALQIRGFEPEVVVPRFLPHRMVSKGPHPMLVRIYLRMPWLWPLMGKQFLVIARKPRSWTPAET